MNGFSIKNSISKEPVTDPADRKRYGLLAAIVGILVNLLLAGFKMAAGIIMNSISVTADAFNNLSDTASSLITLLGFKLSSRPADKDHPFGHGRIEYFSGLIVSLLVMYVGIQFLVTSFKRLNNPSPLEFQWLPVILLTVSIIVKVFLSMFNTRVGTKINSGALKASDLDARSDVFISSTVVAGLLVSRFTGYQIDGIVGIFVAVMILRSAISLIRETVNPLMGNAPDPDLVRKMEEILSSHPEIYYVHDTITHNYGPNTVLATTHTDVRDDISVREIHDIIDSLEKRIKAELNIDLTIHMDPNRTSDEASAELIRNICLDLMTIPGVHSLHDLRLSDDRSRFIAEIVTDAEMDQKNILSQAVAIVKKHGLEADLSLETNEIVVSG